MASREKSDEVAGSRSWHPLSISQVNVPSNPTGFAPYDRFNHHSLDFVNGM